MSVIELVDADGHHTSFLMCSAISWKRAMAVRCATFMSKRNHRDLLPFRPCTSASPRLLGTASQQQVPRRGGLLISLTDFNSLLLHVLALQGISIRLVCRRSSGLPYRQTSPALKGYQSSRHTLPMRRMVLHLLSSLSPLSPMPLSPIV